jgi:hypothetical protein
VAEVIVAGGPSEALPLAQELARAHRDWVAYHLRHAEGTPEERAAKANQPPPDHWLDRVLNGPPDQVSWHGLSDVAGVDPDAACRRWEEIKAAAREELRSGHRAARKVEGYTRGPWHRAQFLALRAELADGWQPRGGMERLLVDTLAQAYTEQEEWIGAAERWLNIQTDRQELHWEKAQGGLPPRVSDVEATEHAMGMAERWNRIFVRTLRALRDLRRYSPSVTIQAAGPVNLGGTQVNQVGTPSIGKVDGRIKG